MELRVEASKTAGSGQSGVQTRILRGPEYPGSKPGLTGPGAQNPISAKNWDFSKDFEMNWIYRFLLDPRGECPRGNPKDPSTFWDRESLKFKIPWNRRERAGTSNPMILRNFWSGGEPSLKIWRDSNGGKVEIAPTEKWGWEWRRGKKRMRVTVKKPDPTRHIYVGLSWSGLSGHGVRTIQLPLKMCRSACEGMIWNGYRSNI